MDDMFVWGLIIGYITGCISGVVIEVFCIMASYGEDERGDDNVMKK